MKKLLFAIFFVCIFYSPAQAETGLFLGGKGSVYYGGKESYGVSYAVSVGYNFIKKTNFPLRLEIEYSPKDFGKENEDGRKHTNNFLLGLYRTLEDYDSSAYLGAIVGISQNTFIYKPTNLPLDNVFLEQNYLMYGLAAGIAKPIFHTICLDFGIRLYSYNIVTKNSARDTNFISPTDNRTIQVETYIGTVFTF